MNFNLNQALKARKAKAQKGFTLIELGIVVVILTVLAALAVPAIRTEIIKGRVSSSADDIKQTMVALKNLASTATTSTPFAGFTATQFSNLFKNSNMKSSGTTVVHSLGAATGNITHTAVDSGAGAGSGLVIAINGINEVACVPMLTSLSKVSDAMAVSGAAVATPAFTSPNFTTGTPVKALGAAYNPTAGAGVCVTNAETNAILVLVNAV